MHSLSVIKSTCIYTNPLKMHTAWEQYFKTVQQTFKEAVLKPISSYWLCTHTAINPLSDSPELIPNEK